MADIKSIVGQDVIGSIPDKQTARAFNVRPTLFIGLGGSGKETLLRLHRLFYERHRQVGLPISRYLWFDTDIRDVNIRGEQWDDIEPAARFTPQESIDMRVEPQQLDELYRNREAHPHIFSWFPYAQVQPLGNNVIMSGAGQVRPLGRLALHMHARTVLDAIEQAGRTVQRADERNAAERMGFQVEHALEIIVVGSLGGGTGSGIFIDVGFMAKHCFPNAMITGIFFLPGVFEASTDVSPGLKPFIKANGYAALMELDHHLAPVIGKAPADEENAYATMTFRWTGDRDFRVAAPPFATVYLVDHAGEAGAPPNDYTEAFQMVAEFLLLDQERNDFSTRKRSNRSNEEQRLHTLTPHRVPDSGPEAERIDFVRFYPNRYSTFGLSQIVVNRLRLANASGYFVAREIMGLWLAEETLVEVSYVNNGLLSNDPDRPGWFRQNRWELENLIHDLLVVKDRGQTFLDGALTQLQGDFDEVERAINELAANVGAAAERPRQVWARILQDLAEVTAKVQVRVTNALYSGRQSKGGEFQQIDAQSTLLEETMKQAAEAGLVALLADADRGPNYARVYLEQLQRRLEDLQGLCKGMLAETPVKLPATKHDEPDALRRLVAAGDLPGFPPKFRSTAQSIVGRELSNLFRMNAGELKGGLLQWNTDRYRRTALEMLVRVLERVGSFVGSEAKTTGRDGKVQIEYHGLRSQLESYVADVKRLRKRFDDLHKAFSRVPNEGRNYYLSPHIEWIPAISEYLGRERGWTGELSERILKVSEDFFRQGDLLRVEGIDPTRIDPLIEGMKEVLKRAFGRGKNSQAWKDVETALEHHCLFVFRLFLGDEANSAVRLFQELPETEHGVIVNRVAQSSWPRLRAPEVQNAYVAQLRSKGIVGVKPSLPWFTELVRRTGPHPMSDQRVSSAIEVGEEDAIVFFTEKVGFPTIAIGGLRGLRQEYRWMFTNPDAVYHRHTDLQFSRFRDILPPEDAAVAQAQVRAYEPVIEGLIVGAISYEPQMGFLLKKVDSYGNPRTEALGGNLEQVVTYLASGGEHMRQTLRDHLDGVYRRWEARAKARGPVNTPAEFRTNPFFRMAALYAYHMREAFARHVVTIRGESYDVGNVLQAVVGKRLQRRARQEVFRLQGLADDQIRVLLQMTAESPDGELKQAWLDLNTLQSDLSKPEELQVYSTEIAYQDPGLDARLRQLTEQAREG